MVSSSVSAGGVVEMIVGSGSVRITVVVACWLEGTLCVVGVCPCIVVSVEVVVGSVAVMVVGTAVVMDGVDPLEPVEKQCVVMSAPSQFELVVTS